MKSITDVHTPTTRPERILQFGEGNFLRAFVDWMVDILNEQGDFNGNVVAVQPIAQGMGEMINAQNGLYTTVLRGVQGGERVEELRTIKSLSRVLNPYEAEGWQAYQAVAESPDLRFVVSNTTEAGIAYVEEAYTEERVQQSFPAKVCALLYRRYKHFGGDPAKGLVFIPCELIDKNGEMLRSIVLRHSDEWGLEAGFRAWVEESCDFLNSLVDRIVPGYPRAEAAALEERLGYSDKVIVSAEIFHLWVIEYTKHPYSEELPFDKVGLNVIWTDDMSFYRTRKVRILNGAHTMSVLAAYQAGHQTVQDCIADKELLYPFMYNGIFEEIIASMDGSKKELESFAADVLERFENPYNPHQLLSISLNSVSKFKTRNLPSLLGYVEKKKALPKRLVFSLAALISFYEGTEFEGTALKGSRDGQTYLIQDSADILAVFQRLYLQGGTAEKKAKRLAEAILSTTAWWGEDLTKVEGLEAMVEKYLVQIWTVGMAAAMKEIV
ncbi:MAG: tagaturonate reductase [Sphaerochaeta sp.]|nr:tagaturonate reductase [Sphaerochaeta sp.]